MLAGAIACSVGTGLLILLDTSTSSVVWVVFMIIAGFGDGLCTNMPYSAIQGIIDEYDKSRNPVIKAKRRRSERDVLIGNGKPPFRLLSGRNSKTDLSGSAAIATFATLAGG